MANKYANLIGPNKIKDEWQKINLGFDKVEQDMDGKAENADLEALAATVGSLDTLSPADRAKFDGIEEGAQVNQNAIAKINDVEADDPSDAVTIVGGTGIAVTSNPLSKEVIVTATGEATPGPHGTSHLPHGSDPIPYATDTEGGLMSAEDKQSLVELEGLPDALAAHKADTAYKNVNDGGYSWWVYPNIIRPEATLYDKTYFSFVNQAKETVIASLDRDSGKYESFVLQTDDAVADEHNTAAITKLADGKIMVAYTKHNTEKKIYIRHSTNAESVSSFDAPIELTTSENVTYAQLIFVNGKYRLFYRSNLVSWMYRESDDGVTWSNETEFIQAPSGQYYIRVVPHGSEIRIAMVGHPINSDDHNIRYARINVLGNILSLSGSILGNLDGTNLPLSPSDFGKIVDADLSEKSTRLLDLNVIVNQENTGVAVVYAEFTDESDAAYKVAKSVGGGVFDISTICSAGSPLEEPPGTNFYFAGAWFDWDNDKTVYVCRESGGAWFVEEYRTADYQSWEKFRTIEMSKLKKLHRPCVPFGGSDKLFFVKGDYTSYKIFNSRIMSK